MVILEVKWSWEDMGDSDCGVDTFRYPELPNNEELQPIIEHHLRVKEEYDDEAIDRFREMLDSGKWYGGRWTREGDVIELDTGTGWRKYNILVQEDNTVKKPTAEELFDRHCELNGYSPDDFEEPEDWNGYKSNVLVVLENLLTLPIAKVFHLAREDNWADKHVMTLVHLVINYEDE